MTNHAAAGETLPLDHYVAKYGHALGKALWKLDSEFSFGTYTTAEYLALKREVKKVLGR